MRRTISFGSVSDIISGHQYAGDEMCIRDSFNWFLCFATGFAVVFFHLQIVNVEEDFLIEAFGNEYLQYKSKVCRYLGRKR